MAKEEGRRKREEGRKVKREREKESENRGANATTCRRDGFFVSTLPILLNRAKEPSDRRGPSRRCL